MAVQYLRGAALGEGTWGSVYEAKRKSDGLKVAIKRIKPMDAHLGMNFTALREIKYLKKIRGANIIDMIDVFVSGGILHLVLEYCPYDLEKVIRDKSVLLRTHHVKSYLRMLLIGLKSCHDNFVLHRDLKPANLLFGRDGQMKLADFGLARSHSSPERMTSEVVTRWYRSPELLFGAPLYSGAVDVWAAGCIFAEIIFRQPLFPGDSDTGQLGKIFNVLGTPSEQTWPGVQLLPNYTQFEHREPLGMLPLFRSSHSSSGGGASADGTAAGNGALHQNFPAELDLLMRMLALNPNKRCTVKQALEHPYFKQLPQPCSPELLPLPAGVSEKILQTKSIDSGVAQLSTLPVSANCRVSLRDNIDAPEPKRARI